MKDDNLRSDPAPRPRGVMPQIPIPGHPITPVPTPRAEYFRCYGQLAIYNTGGPEYGSGTLIAAGDGFGILTCAHNLYDPATAAAAERIEFYPAKDGRHDPYGTISAESEMLRIPDAYLAAPTSEDKRNDYAVVRLYRDQIPSAVGALVTMESISITDPIAVQVTGYPDDSPTQPYPAMYYSRGHTLNDPSASGVLRYDASTQPGSSGCAVTRVLEGQPDVAHVNAIHVSRSPRHEASLYNRGVYLTPEIIRWVTRQITD